MIHYLDNHVYVQKTKKQAILNPQCPRWRYNVDGYGNGALRCDDLHSAISNYTLSIILVYYFHIAGERLAVAVYATLIYTSFWCRFC